MFGEPDVLAGIHRGVLGSVRRPAAGSTCSTDILYESRAEDRHRAPAKYTLFTLAG